MQINQRQLLCPRASLQLFLTGNSRVDIGVSLKVHQLMHVVLFGEAFVHAGFVLAHAPGQVVGYANVNQGVVCIGEQVDIASAYYFRA